MGHGLFLGHDAFRGGEDCDPEPAQHAGHLVLLRVNPEAWSAYSLDPGYHRAAARPVFQVDHDCVKVVLLHNLVLLYICLLYTSDAADDLLCVDLGGRRIIKKKKKKRKTKVKQTFQ